ncbi:MAG: RimK family alpha-L-glutamate ligase [Clostridiales bacterium]|nr:RimK family alpha-L-glutamate ligase [Clostridiales bacterium]
MKKCLILINAYSRLKSSLNQSERLKEELEKLGVTVDILPNDFFAAQIDCLGNIQTKTQEYDFCIYLDKDKYISHMLEKSGLRLFNSHEAIRLCDDKMLTSITLADSKIPMPKTLAGLLCYDEGAEIAEETFKRIENELGYPVVVKTSFGSLGKGVFKADNRAELVEIANNLKCTPHLFQQFVKSSSGMDIRVIVIGGKFVASMIRSSNGDFRSNLELGGRAQAFTPPKEVISLCERTAKLLKLDYCGIDVLFGGEGYCICEVNSNAFFGGIEKVTNINIAKAYAEYIYNSVYKGE